MFPRFYQTKNAFNVDYVQHKFSRTHTDRLVILMKEAWNNLKTWIVYTDMNEETTSECTQFRRSNYKSQILYETNMTSIWTTFNENIFFYCHLTEKSGLPISAKWIAKFISLQIYIFPVEQHCKLREQCNAHLSIERDYDSQIILLT